MSEPNPLGLGQDEAAAQSSAKPSASGHDEDEEIYFQGTPKVRGVLGSVFGWFIAAIILAAVGVLGLVFAFLFWWASLLCFALAAVVFAMPFLLARTTHFRISSYRIDYERGLLSKRIDTLELWHVDDISFHQSLADRFLGVGTIEVFSSDATTPNLQLRGLPDPRPVFDALRTRIIAVKRQRGVVKMDLG